MVVGLVGLGNIGFHFGSRLLDDGHDIVVFDKSKAAIDRLVAKGSQSAPDIETLASLTDVVLLSLPKPDIVVDVASALGNSTRRATEVVVDLSTTGPSATRTVEQNLSDRGIALIGAPVSGGTVAAQNGTLAVMAAGPRSDFDRVAPLLQVIGKSLFYLGEDPTLGQTMKIINNTLYAAALVVSSEALVYGVKAGLDPEMILNVVNASSGRSFATLERIPQCVLDRSFPLRFTTELLHKDVKMCVDEAEKIGAPLMISPAVRQFLAFAITQGDGELDNASIIRHFEKWAGVEFGRSRGPEIA